jgi:cyclin C
LVSRPSPAQRAASSAKAENNTASVPGTPTSNILSASNPARASGQQLGAASEAGPGASEKNAGRGKTDLVTFLASLDVSLPIVLEIVQEMISLYACWKAFDDPPSGQGSQGQNTGSVAAAAAVSGPGMQNRLNGNVPIGPGDERTIKLLSRMRAAREVDLAHPANAGQP